MQKPVSTLVLSLMLFAGTTAGAFADDHGHAAPAHSDSHATDDHGGSSHGSDSHATESKKPAASTPAKKTPTSTAKPAPKAKAKPAEKPTAHAGEPAEAKSDALTSKADEENTAPAPKIVPVSMKTAAETPTADQALQLLIEGNSRWVSNRTENPSTEVSRRAEVSANGQKPFATVLTCADSRIPLERAFDRGVGEIFAIRVAGNIAGESETGTIEYGLEHLKTPLLVVMGHTKCGAVAASASGAQLHGAIGRLVGHVQPALDRAKKANPGLEGDALVAATVRENVWQSVYDLLKNSPEIREQASTGKVKVVGAIYDLATGKVEFMGEHPWQREVLAALNTGTNTGTSEAPGTESKTATVDEHAGH